MESVTEKLMTERFHPRVETQILIKVMANGRTYLAQAADLSMAGCRIMDAPVIKGDRLQIIIPLPDQPDLITGCEIRRRDEDSIAVEFDTLDWDDLLGLARYLHPRLP